MASRQRRQTAQTLAAQPAEGHRGADIAHRAHVVDSDNPADVEIAGGSSSLVMHVQAGGFGKRSKRGASDQLSHAPRRIWPRTDLQERFRNSDGEIRNLI